MAQKQIFRVQKTPTTDIERLFKTAVDKLMTVWDDKSEYNVAKLKGIVHDLRSTKQFPNSVYDKLEGYFRDDGKFYIERGGVLIADNSKKVLDLLSVLDAETEIKILRESWDSFHYYLDALHKMIANPVATLDDGYIAFTYGFLIPDSQTVKIIKHLWNKEVAKANGGQPGAEAQNKYAFIVRCVYLRSAHYSKNLDKQSPFYKKYASELYRMNAFDRELISRKELIAYKQAQKKYNG